MAELSGQGILLKPAVAFPVEMYSDSRIAEFDEADAELERQAERDILAKAIDALPETEHTVVSLYYYEGLTLKEIGRVLGVTESRACQVHGKAILRLRARVQSLLETPPARKAAALATGAKGDARTFASDAAGP